MTAVPLNVIVGIPSHEQPSTIAVYRHADTVDWLLAEARWWAEAWRVTSYDGATAMGIPVPRKAFPWEAPLTNRPSS